jgi:uncharacterized membrane protein
MGFIKTILIIVVAFYVIGFIGRMLVPMFIKRQVRKFQQGTGNNNKHKERKNEGEITVNSKSKQENLLDATDTEYVDFEEVD